MKTIRYLFTLSLFLLAVSCGELELPEETANGNDSSGSKEGTMTKKDDGSPFTVAELDSVADGTDIELVGYIVGSTQSSMKNTDFGTAEAVSSNIVLADSPTEKEYAKCAPIQLNSNTVPREELNLVDNPENLGRHIIVGGTKTKYFNTAGIKSVEYYVDADEEEPDDTPTEEGDTTVTVTLDENAEVFDGD